MLKNQINVQDHFLNQMRRQKNKVSVLLMNGEKIEGLINSFDNFSLIIENEGLHLLYKHSIMRISPIRPVRRLEYFNEKTDK